MKLSLLVGVALLFVSNVFAVEEGDSLDAVLKEKGAPSSRMQLADTLVLNYPDAMIKVRENKVVSVKYSDGDTGARTVTTVSPGEWTTSYESALEQAKDENRKVFLFFTGSDWCGWCQLLDREVLSTREFQAYAQQKLLLVKIDFPRTIAQTYSIKQQNQHLLDQYEVGGYPTVIVLNSRGKMLGRLGYEPGGPKAFISRIKRM